MTLNLLKPGGNTGFNSKEKTGIYIDLKSLGRDVAYAAAPIASRAVWGPPRRGRGPAACRGRRGQRGPLRKSALALESFASLGSQAPITGGTQTAPLPELT